MKFSLKNKIAVVTGGGSGIGKAIAETFAQMGAVVCILDLNLDNAQTTKENIDSNGGQSKYYICDVTNQNTVNQSFDAICEAEGRVDILVNSAGISHIGNISSTTIDDMDRVYSVNVKGVYNCMKKTVDIFQERGRGVILNVASIASSVGVADRFAYSMSKGAVLSMTYSVAKDYVTQKIRCNSISPARIHTPFVDDFIKKNYPNQEDKIFEKLSKTQPIGRMGTPQEVADLALYLCSEEAGFITGTDFPIDGGFIKLQG